MVWFRDFGLSLLIFLAAHAARAQTDPNTPPSTDYGAGYEMVMVTQDQQHALGSGVDPSWGSTIKLDKTYPLISSPLTPDAKAFNAEIDKILPEWWNGPTDNKVQSDPDTDITLDCEPAGEDPPVDGKFPDAGGMLPGVISVACMNYSYMHGAPHGGGTFWGFNWLVHERRRVKADDIFAPHTQWLKAFAALLNADQNANGPPAFPVDGSSEFGDPSHWVVAINGLGFIDSCAGLYGFDDGGQGAFVLIPWSQLRPYLNPHGIVPQVDWNATLPSTN